MDADQDDWTSRRSHFRENWLSSIEELSNQAMQRATWLNPTRSNPHYSFNEYLICYFFRLEPGAADPTYDAVLAEGFVSANEVAAVMPLHSALAVYQPPNGDPYDEAAILDDPKWIAITSAAGVARERLATLLSDPVEISWLSTPAADALEAAKVR